MIVDKEIPRLVILEGSLHRGDRHVPHPHLGNIVLCLALDPVLDGVAAYDEFAEEPLIMRPPPPLDERDPPATGPYPRSIRSADLVAITAYIQRNHLPRVVMSTVEDALRAEAERHRFHPVRDWLAGLHWDGTPRLDTWLSPAFGVTNTPYTAAVGAKLLIAAVRRVRQPGCKFDTMAIFEGAQGIGKSRTIRRLFGEEWFTDSLPPDLKSKDSAQAVLGVWCIELAEIAHLIRTEAEVVKAFLSRPEERYRPVWERSIRKRGRECVIVGTTNETNYLSDPTGGRRFWPIAATHADENWVRENRDQLWAEAAAREAAGESVWLEEEAHEEAQTAQADRMVDDPWAEPARKWLDGQRAALALHVTMARFLAEGVGLDARFMTRAAQMRAGNILAKEGLIKVVKRVDGRSVKVWRWPA